MRGFLKWIEAALAAAAFAEEGDEETARLLLREADRDAAASGAPGPPAARPPGRRPRRGKVARLP